MRPGKIVLLVVGVLVGVLGLGLAAGAGALLLAATQRDAGGYLTTNTQRFSTPTYALTSHVPVMLPDGRAPGWIRDLATIRVRAAGVGGTPVFVGVARQADVDRWLAGTAHDEVTDVGSRSTYRPHSGTQPAAAPGSQQFWVASAVGSAPQTLTWRVEGGSWDIVVINADAHQGVAADVSAGVRVPAQVPIGAGLGIVGLILLGAGIALVALSVAGRSSGPAGRAEKDRVPAGGPPVAPGSYPVRVDGRLDPPLSRWLWLVKFFLVIPHLFVLLFLWIAFGFLTVVAWFAILLTGRYPRSIFDFNVGVMRWTWRVGFYSFGVFGTDRYPPFSLATDPGYPAELAVDYPEHLSRGLALVKWWLLAIPHYLIVGILTGSFAVGWARGAFRLSGGGLIGLLALIAAVVLAATGRYPAELFDLLMGLNRWVWRVAAYAGLMRDEYPPFRLDLGGTDPGTTPPAPVGAGATAPSGQ